MVPYTIFLALQSDSNITLARRSQREIPVKLCTMPGEHYIIHDMCLAIEYRRWSEQFVLRQLLLVREEYTLTTAIED